MANYFLYPTSVTDINNKLNYFSNICAGWYKNEDVWMDDLLYEFKTSENTQCSQPRILTNKVPHNRQNKLMLQQPLSNSWLPIAHLFKWFSLFVVYPSWFMLQKLFVRLTGWIASGQNMVLMTGMVIKLLCGSTLSHSLLDELNCVVLNIIK